jgi:hypothetical protein
MLNNYLKSFKDKNIFYYFTIDGLGILSIMIMWKLYNSILTNLGDKITGGKSIDDLKLAIISSTDAAQTIAANIKIFMILFMAGLVVFILLTIFVFSYSRMKMWRSKKFWRWNGVTLAVAGCFMLYSLVAFLVKFMMNNFFTFSTQAKAAKFDQVYLLISIILFIAFSIFAFRKFSLTMKVSDSIPYALRKFKTKVTWLKISLITLTGLVAGIILNWIQVKLYWTLIVWPRWLLISIQVIIFLLYLAWMRSYLIKKI